MRTITSIAVFKHIQPKGHQKGQSQDAASHTAPPGSSHSGTAGLLIAAAAAWLACSLWSTVLCPLNQAAGRAKHHWHTLIGEPFHRVILDDFDPARFDEFLDNMPVYFGERAVVLFLCLFVSVPMGFVYSARVIRSLGF